MMMKLGMADGMVSGACHSTAATMRPALQLLKTAPGFDIVSSVFFMLLNDGVKVFGDCAINVAPSADELAQIAVAFCVEIEFRAPPTPSTRRNFHTGRVGAYRQTVRRFRVFLLRQIHGTWWRN